MYGDGAWPHYSAYERNELASNGNYYEPDAIAVRHEMCGDPEQVSWVLNNSYDGMNTVMILVYSRKRDGTIHLEHMLH